MKQKAEIINDLEDQILPRLKQVKVLQEEVDTLQKTVSALRALDGNGLPAVQEAVQDGSLLDNYPGYPINGLLIDKYRYLEDKTLKVWKREDMDHLIEKIEGKRQANKVLKSARQKSHYYISRFELIKLRYNNKNTYSFYTTRPEWVEKIDHQGDGTKISFRLLSEHEPDINQLSGLSEEERKPENITWNGIK